ncbi:uncharacterized protein LOC111881603 [Lactuca sativa]|uniref:uncharacterized protein LOC111881603 n=1 Tax=Lactuca sativa TaxID=4236 RepID=UPI0022AFE3C8|nr:uncharacterized protein LOC111881603 [Lactuca sativa]
MDRLHVPIMADSLLSSIATFHTTKIIVTNPTKYSFIGSIPESMLARTSASSNVLQQYKKHPSSGPRELTPAMVYSIEEADKPAKRGKKTENQKEAPVSKPTKGQAPKKRKSDKAATSQAQPKKQKKPARRLVIQSSSDSDSKYVPPKHKNAPPSESESESSDDEASGQGNTPPRSPTSEIPVCSHPPSPPPVTIPSDDDDDEPVTKRHLKAVKDKLDQLLSSSSSGAYSEAALKALFTTVVQEHSASLSTAAKSIEASTSQCQQASLAAAATKNAQTVNASMDNPQRSLQSERSNLEAARQAIEAANETLHANVNDRLTPLEAELAVENHIMDELYRRTSQLKIQNYKLRTATAEVNDLNHIEGVLVTGVQPKQGGEKVKTQPPSGPKPSTVPKGNEASVKPSKKEMEENYKKQKAELEQKRKEAELLEKKKSMFPVWTIDSLQRCAIDEPSIL